MSTVVLEHSEYFCDLFSNNPATTESQYQWLVNPGNYGIFPYAAQIAQAFQQYEFEYLIFEFRSTSALALNSTNTQLGLVAARAEYNPTQTLDANTGIMLNSYGKIQSSPASSWKFRFSVANHEKLIRSTNLGPGPLNVAGGPTQPSVTNYGLQANEDIRMYDQGWFAVFVSNLQSATVNIGQMWVHYKVRFFRSILTRQIGFSVFGSEYILRGTVASATPLGTTAAQPGNAAGTGVDSIPVLIATGSNSINFPNSLRDGYYGIHITWIGTPAAWTAPVITFSRCVLAINASGNLSKQCPENGVTAGQVSVFVVIRIQNASGQGGAQVTIGNAGTLPTAITSAFVNVCQQNPRALAVTN